MIVFDNQSDNSIYYKYYIAIVKKRKMLATPKAQTT